MKNKTVIFMFSGQGSQYYHMGKELFQKHRTFKEWMRKLDALANEIIGESVLDQLYSEKKSISTVFDRMLFTHPAIFMVEVALARVMLETGIKPDVILGSSMGEFAAAAVSGVMSPEDLLGLVVKQAEVIETHSQTGGMLTILHHQDLYHDNPLLYENSQLAAVNYSTHFVVSGTHEQLQEITGFLKQQNITFQLLPVSYAFHSPLIDAARAPYLDYLSNKQFQYPAVPYISCMEGKIINRVSGDYFWQIARKPFFFPKALENLKPDQDYVFLDLGPSGTMANFVKNNRTNHANCFTVMTPFGGELEKIKKLKQFFGLESYQYEKERKEEKQEVKETPVREAEPPQPPGITSSNLPKITVDNLGSKEFKSKYNLKYAYLTGGMYKGIASREIAVKMGRAGMLGFFGTGGLELDQVARAIQYIQDKLNNGQAYGMNLVANPLDPEEEEKMVDLFLKHGVPIIEAAAYMQLTPALVKYRAKGLKRNSRGEITINNKIIAKISRPEVAEQFLQPAPERILKKLLDAGKITPQQGELLREVSMVDDLCVEADSGGHTDQRMPYALLPALMALRDEKMKKYKFANKPNLGAAGGIGTPGAAAAAFILGADFILTGSINQCTVEAGTSDEVKNILQDINVQDTDYAPAGDMFEMGAKVQVLKKGVFFPARANKLYDLYQNYNSLEEIDEKTRKQLQERYFKRSFEEIYQEAREFYPPQEIERAEQNPKYKMALIFRWYFGYSTRLALEGNTDQRVDFQVHCGPALGAFNQWVKGTPLENWKNRHVDEIAEKLMKETAELLNRRFNSLIHQ